MAVDNTENDVENGRAAALARIEAWQQRAPKFKDETITMAHGAGGKAWLSLLEAVIRPALSNPTLDQLDDGAVLQVPDGHEVVLTTDAFVVTPRFFPGGSIGDLAVNGTVNDLSVMGAIPQVLTLSLVLEEGLAVDELRTILADVATSAEQAGVMVVSGDTKVVERRAADGCYLTTTGLGFRPPSCALGIDQIEVGDVVICSGPVGDHGVAVMVARGDLALSADIESDTASLFPLVRELLAAAPGTRWLRDATRGGVASVLNELAAAASMGVEVDEASVPVRRPVAGACELLGLDPLYIANEGTLIAVVPAADADAALAAIQSTATGEQAAVVGRIVDDHQGLVVARTAFGGSRILDMLVGDPLPRIC